MIASWSSLMSPPSPYWVHVAGMNCIGPWAPALDKMDGGEVIPGHTELRFRLLVVTEKLIDRLGLDDLPFRKVLRAWAIHYTQLFARFEARGDRGTRLLGKRGENGGLPVGEVLKPAVRELLEVPHPLEVRGAQIRIADRDLNHGKLRRKSRRIIRRGRERVPVGLRARRWRRRG